MSRLLQDADQRLREGKVWVVSGDYKRAAMSLITSAIAK